MSKCYMCGCDINKNNETEEHIFLNSIGGKLKSKKLICVTCNSEFGDDIDASLSKQLNYFANMLNIERDRGKPQPFNVVNEKNGIIYSYEPGGNPKMLKPKITRGEKCYNVVASDIKQARQILKGLKRKHPEIDIDKALEKSQENKKYIDGMLGFQINLGGDKEFRSICKMAINFYLYSGGSQEYIKHLIPYLKCESDSNSDVKEVFAYLDNEPIDKKEKDILHNIIVVGNKNEKLLYAYIELFNFYKVIVLLNENYLGNDVEYKYFFDVILRTEVEREYDLKFSKEKINNMINQVDLPINKMMTQINELMKKVYVKQEKEHINKLAKAAIDNSLGKYPEGELITHEMSNELVDEAMKQFTPWIAHNLKKQ